MVTKTEVRKLQDLSQNLRRKVITMLYRAKSGHPGGPMSVMEVLVCLYFGGILEFDPRKPQLPSRDYFLLSYGHSCPALYAVLSQAGFFPKVKLEKFRVLRGLEGHPRRNMLPGIEISGGSLGQGLSVGIGIAIGLQKNKQNNKVFVLTSDGEHEEGSHWEAVMSASKFKLQNLIVIVDKNRFQIDGATADIMPSLDNLDNKYQAFDWQVLSMDGHDVQKILTTLKKAKELANKSPVVVISHSIRGKGVSFMENSADWHHGIITKDLYKQAMVDLKS